MVTDSKAPIITNRITNNHQYSHRNKIAIIFLVMLGFALVFFGGLPSGARAATLSMGPATGTFSVGSTFDVSLLLNTEGQSINTLDVSMSFSPDKLQLVSPSAGKSIIEIWTAPPEFNNQTGRVKLQGGIPGGVNVSSGLIITLTFRVKSVGPAIFKFLDDSRVLLNDGLGTDALKNTTNGVYQLVLPPPAGPIVVSPTHPDQATWYSNPNMALEWASEGNVEGYSYILNKEPVDSLDNISDGHKTSVVYKNLSDGAYYFHIKSLRNGAWGGITHFAVHIDTTPPAEFPVEIIPSSRTTRKQPVVQFESSDSSSGIDHYELKIILLTLSVDTQDQPLFIEVESPHVLSQLALGKYDVIIRAYDKAGNYREVVKHLAIVTTAFNFIGDGGFEIRNVIFVPWPWFWTILILMLIVLVYGALHIKKWHDYLDQRLGGKVLPREVQDKLEELKRYKSKYGPKVLLWLLVLGASLVLPSAILAQRVEITPPLITTISRNISNEEIFYVGGKTDVSQANVILYLQNLEDGQTTSYEIISDKNGDWFYRHDSFLTTGNYLLWAQSKVEDQLSPPSPQVQMNVRSTAIQFGSSRLSYETVYLILIMVLFLATAGLVYYIVFHAYQGRKKHLHFIKEVKEAEESVRRGFAVLRRDIQGEFSLIKKARLEGVLSDEQRVKEDQLAKDLRDVEQYIGKEIWDIEENEYSS